MPYLAVFCALVLALFGSFLGLPSISRVPLVSRVPYLLRVRRFCHVCLGLFAPLGSFHLCPLWTPTSITLNDVIRNTSSGLDVSPSFLWGVVAVNLCKIAVVSYFKCYLVLAVHSCLVGVLEGGCTHVWSFLSLFFVFFFLRGGGNFVHSFWI